MAAKLPETTNRKISISDRGWPVSAFLYFGQLTLADEDHLYCIF